MALEKERHSQARHATHRQCSFLFRLLNLIDRRTVQNSTAPCNLKTFAQLHEPRHSALAFQLIETIRFRVASSYAKRWSTCGILPRRLKAISNRSTGKKISYPVKVINARFFHFAKIISRTSTNLSLYIKESANANSRKVRRTISCKDD